MVQAVEILPNERQKLLEKFEDKLEMASHLSRKVVSFQANKDEPIYRWFKYKEGFSSSLVKYFLTEYSDRPGKVLDPFAGVGTTIFAGQEIGWEGYGIEVLPVGVFVMQVREALNGIRADEFKFAVQNLWNELEQIKVYNPSFHHVSITKDAFPDETEKELNKYLAYCERIPHQDLRTILRFAAFAVLEEVSYTRKDGQYLRWDHRSKRALTGKPFDKGKVPTFYGALKNKLSQVLADLSPQSHTLFDVTHGNGHKNPSVKILRGTCLEELPKLEDKTFDFIITSPPYCNRYDYTRTYALELVFLGSDNDSIRNLRQQLLSCTVENKEKTEYLSQLYRSFGNLKTFDRILKVYNNNAAMTEVNEILEILNAQERLNNSNIPRMVRNYFLELCFVIYEMSRVMKAGGYCVMVNDNVRYGGEEIPVDLILSEFAQNFDFNVEKIFVLPQGKGNSSQQMGNYGRTEIRKCVYLWQKR